MWRNEKIKCSLEVHRNQDRINNKQNKVMRGKTWRDRRGKDNKRVVIKDILRETDKRRKKSENETKKKEKRLCSRPVIKIPLFLEQFSGVTDVSDVQEIKHIRPTGKQTQRNGQIDGFSNF